jgi:hypothetical protein
VPHKDPEKRREFIRKWRAATREKVREAYLKWRTAIATKPGWRTVNIVRPILRRCARGSASIRPRSERGRKNAAIPKRRVEVRRDATPAPGTDLALRRLGPRWRGTDRVTMKAIQYICDGSGRQTLHTPSNCSQSNWRVANTDPRDAAARCKRSSTQSPDRRSRSSSAFRMASRGGAASHGSRCDKADARREFQGRPGQHSR